MGIPVVRLEVSSMSHAIQTAMTNHLLELDSDVREAIKACCTEENVKRVIAEEIQRALRGRIFGVIESAFHEKDGIRREIEEVVERELLRRAPDIARLDACAKRAEEIMGKWLESNARPADEDLWAFLRKVREG